MEGHLIDFKQESSVDPSGSLTPSPQADNFPAAGKFPPSNHTNQNNVSGIDSSDYTGVQRDMSKSAVGKEGEGDQAGKCWPWSKRDRLKRDPSLDKLDEEVDGLGAGGAEGQTYPEIKEDCSDYFGVKSYLHHFYEWPSYKDPSLYEEDWGDDATSRLLYPGGAKRGRCRCDSLCWKVFAFVGVCLLLIGATSVLIGYVVPSREPTVGFVTQDEKIVDRYATDFNEKLDLCKIIGLILFCAGGLTLTIALMIPSVLYRYCDDDRREAPFSVQSGDVRVPRKDLMGSAVPTSSKLAEVQPARKGDEPLVTQLIPSEVHYSQPVPAKKR